MSKILLASYAFLLLWLTPFVTEALTNSQPALDSVFDSQVMIRTEGRNADGESVPNYCNGTLIGPRILITAAHCVAQSWYLRDNVMEINVGRYKIIQRPDGRLVRIGYANFLKSNETVQVWLSPLLQENFRLHGIMTEISPEEDIAVVTLSRELALPSDFSYRLLVAKSQLPQVLQSIAQLQPTLVTVNPWAEVRTNDTKRFAVLNQVSWNSAWFESSSAARVEEGDSGAGLLVKIGSQYQLLAVVKGRANSLFSNWDIYALAVGKVCELAQKADLNVDERATLCR